jgi:hypothetical protein
MDWNYLQNIDPDFSDESRVWVYQASRPFNETESAEIQQMLDGFTSQWKSHGTPVKGAGYLFFNQFLILMADEAATGVSGCSTDSSVRLVKDIEQRFETSMFDRTTLAFVVDDRPRLLNLDKLQLAYDTGMISKNTLYFNNLVQTKDELQNRWMIPIEDSWLTRRISFKNTVS